MLIPLTTEQQQWVDTTLNAMNLPQCAGQLLCAFSPRFTTDDWLGLLKKVPIGALTVRGASSGDLREQMHVLQDQSKVPLLASADLEHGAVALSDGTEFPWMMGAGAANDVELMTIMGQLGSA